MDSSFPDRPVTFHGNENTMGGGKGAVDIMSRLFAPVLLFEMAGVTESIAREAFRLAGHKFGVKTTL